MSEKNKYKNEDLFRYFQSAPTFSLDEKLHWYRFILAVLVMANEEEKSKDGKRFKYNFERHKVIIAAIEVLLHKQSLPELEGVSRDYSQGIIPLLKKYCQQFRNAAHAQVDKLFQEYMNNVDVYAEEKSFWENPIAIHAKLFEVFKTIPLIGASDEIETASRKVCTQACEQINRNWETIEQEISSGKVSPIRAAWLAELFIENDKSIIYVCGQWRLVKALHELYLKDFRMTGQEIKESTDEKEQMMLDDLLELYDEQDENEHEHDSDENQSDLDEGNCSASHDDHECCL